MENKIEGLEESCNSKFHTRGYLPHYDVTAEPQMITFNLHDSLPKPHLIALSEELKVLTAKRVDPKRCSRIEELLDRGIGHCHLSNPRIAQMVAESLRYYDGHRYILNAWVIMPNHVHVLLTPKTQNSISTIVHSWKSFTAKQANRILGQQGPFWQREYFDRRIRNDRHFQDVVKYIHNNPLKAGLCESADAWIFSSAHLERGEDDVQ